jgi:hypothetical protein|uniref:SMODS and SLOG-associating 2TM effector domain-containing protein n=1 Tax=viral metagenome TaxID=1070528 RepID=A0A6C0DY82_9ZZZZ
MSNENEDKPTEVLTIENYEWSVEHEHILAEWADKAMCYRWLHTRSNSLYSSLNAWYTIPCIIISTLAGTANFAQTRIPVKYQALFTMVVGGMNILGGIIGTIQQFLKITQLNEAHRVSSIAWDKFYRNIKIELAKHPNERIAVTHMLKMSKEEFDRLMETSPVIPDKIIGEFKRSFSGTEEYKTISKPEICDVLISTEKFRNPWYTDANQAKRYLELTQQTTNTELKKKALEKLNVYTIKNFYKTFHDLNNREPMEQEVISNLSESIDADTIKRLISEMKDGMLPPTQV